MSVERLASGVARIAAAAIVRVAAASCAHRAKGSGAPPPPRPAERVATLLAGRFSSEAQSRSAPDFQDIRLIVVRIWPDRKDGPWLYVEQAEAGKESEPYRQRVYRLVDDRGGAVRSVIYALPEPKAAVGAWKGLAPLASVRPETLTLRRGCDVVLHETPAGTWEGGTEGKECASDLRGAAYATSEVTLAGSGMVSWDRGFDAAGKQVWGAESGGYAFVRQP